jgi:hypothetical protein
VATKECLHELIDRLPDTPETDRRLAAAGQELEPNGASDDSAKAEAEHRAVLERVAGYFDHPETAP